jgi:hypothetical protein
MSFAEYLAAAQAAEKSGMSGKDFVKQQRQAQVQKEASQTFNYGIRNTNTYRPPAPPPQQKQAPTVVIQQPQTTAPPTDTSTTPATTDTSTTTGTTTTDTSSPSVDDGGVTPTVDPFAEAQKRFDQQIADMQAQMAEQAKAQERAMQLMVSQYQTAQQEATAAAERQRRQMQIAQAYGQSDPADVRFSRSRAQRAGMVSAGATGAFGRQGLRIRNLNVSAGKNAASNTAGSFA